MNRQLALFGACCIGVVASFTDTLDRSGAHPVLSLLQFLANSVSLWGVYTVYVNRRLGHDFRRSVIFGILLLIAAVTTYYAYGMLLGDRTHVATDDLLRAFAMWLGLATVGGIFYGFLSWLYGLQKWRLISVFIMAAVFVAEILYALLNT